MRLLPASMIHPITQLTASYKKPNSQVCICSRYIFYSLTSAQSILRNSAIPNYLKPMPFQKVLETQLTEALD